MRAATMPPCPVILGEVKDDGQVAQLHRHTMEKNLHKMEKLLKKGVDVDSVNHLGQTPLFCAALLGLTSAVELLLQHGADPNHRCGDRSTPVHAAVFSCKPRLLSAVLDAGGDLRLHDQKGRTPQDWAEEGALEQSPKMMDFLKSCASNMHRASQLHQPQDVCRSPGSSVPTLRSRSLLDFLVHGGRRNSSVCDTTPCYGFGKLCIDRPRHLLGLLACLPTIEDSELRQADDEPMLSYSCGAFTQMTNKTWRGCRVTVKEMQSHCASERDSYLDLLIIEQQFCSRLFHPHLLQLLAVSFSEDLQHIRLVFERVHIGSLYSLLYHRHEELQLLGEGALLPVVLQVCEALLFLHDRGLVLRGLSSHSVQIVHPCVAKVTGLGFMMPRSEGDGSRDPTHLPLPLALYNWAAPEVICQKAVTEKADLYSLCALIQELYTDAVPWGQMDPLQIEEAVILGQALEADPRVPSPFYELVQSGLQPRAQDRNSSLQDLHHLLHSNVRELNQGRRRVSGLHSEAGACNAAGWSPELTMNREQEHTGWGPMAGREVEAELHPIGWLDRMVGREIGEQLDQLEQLLWKVIQWKQWWCGGDPGWPAKVGKEEAPAMSAQSSMQAETSRDERCLSLSPRTDPDSSRTYCSEASGGENEGGALRGEPPIWEAEPLSIAALNLAMSQVLLHHSESSLRAAEAVGWGRHPSDCTPPSKPTNHRERLGCGVDEVDSGKRRSSRERSSSAPTACRASGPPSARYPPLSQGPLCISSGTQRKREEEGYFNTVDGTLSTTDRGQDEEESTIESDYTQSPLEPCGVFFTPGLQLQPHYSGGHSMTFTSEEDLEVTVEVCQPAMTAAGEAMETRGCGSSEDRVDCRIAERSGRVSPSASPQGGLPKAAGPPASHYQPPHGILGALRNSKPQGGACDISMLTPQGLPSLSEEASEEQSEDEEQSLYTSAQEESFLNPCNRFNQVGRISMATGLAERDGQKAGTEQTVSKQWGNDSTYVLSAASQSQEVQSNHFANAKWSSDTPTVHLRSLDTLAWSSSTPQPFSTENLSTSSSVEPSVASILLSPVLSVEESATPTNLQDFTPTGSDLGPPAGTPGAPSGPGTGGRRVAWEGSTVTASRSVAGPPPEDDSESEQSDPGSGDSGCAVSFGSASMPAEGAAIKTACVPVQSHAQKGGILLDEEEEEEKTEESAEEAMSEEESREEEPSDEVVPRKGHPEKADEAASHFGPGPATLYMSSSAGKPEEMKQPAGHRDLLEEVERQRKGREAGDSKSHEPELPSQTDGAGAGYYQKPK